MQQASTKLQSLIEPIVVSLGFELVGVEFLSQGKHSLLRVYIDSENGINLDDCGTVSHQLSGLLDVEDVIRGHYNLEVSSPGLDRPLFSEAHFKRFVGAEAKLKIAAPIDGSRKFRGVIRGVSADKQLSLDVDGTEIQIPLDQIEKANLVPDFK